MTKSDKFFIFIGKAVGYVFLLFLAVLFFLLFLCMYNEVSPLLLLELFK